MNESKRKLSFWETIDNFWYYHKWKVVAAIAVVVGIWAAISYTSGFKGDEKPHDLSIVSVFARPLSTEDYNYADVLGESIRDIDNNGEKHIKTDSFYITEGGDGQNDQLSIAQFENTLAYSRSDLILLDKTNLDRFISKDFFEPISEYVDLSGIPKDDIVSRNGIPVAVRLSDSKALLDMGFIVDSVYASVMYIPENATDEIILSRENTKAVIKKLLEK